MTARSWLDHPTLAAASRSGIHTRLGISPNHRSFRVGVLRTHLLTALLAHAAAGHHHTAVTIAVRCDDTNPRTARPEHLTALLHEIHQIAAIPTTGPVITQAERRDEHLTALHTLAGHGVITYRDGAALLDLDHTRALIHTAGEDPDEIIRRSSLDSGRRLRHPTRYVPLTRADGTVLWHLASVVDDLNLGITLVVRGTDKRDALAVQALLRHLLTDPAQPVAYLHLPRLLEPDGPVRVHDLLTAGIRPCAIRWYLAEPFLHPHSRPQTFTDLVQGVRPLLPAPRDSRLDPPRLAALDRKLSAALDPQIGAAELAAVVGPQRSDLVAQVAATCRRPLPAQVRRYAQLNQPTAPGPPPTG